MRNAAEYWKDGQVVEVASKDLVGTAKPYLISPGCALEAYPNGGSTLYKERDANYISFAAVLVKSRFLDDAEQDIFKQPVTWKDATQAILGASSSTRANLESTIASRPTFNSPEEDARP
ncbi:saccharopine dehydrogenase (NADP+, L-glutamate-forming) [Parahypoxylon ruwenzoriense]